MATETTKTNDESQIRQLIADQAKAICAKNLDAIMAPYARDVINFDVKPPFQTKGAEAWRQSDKSIAAKPRALGHPNAGRRSSGYS